MAGALTRLRYDVSIAILKKGNTFSMSKREIPYDTYPAVSFSSLRQYYILFNTLFWDKHWKEHCKQFHAVIAVCGTPHIAYPLLSYGLPLFIWSAVTMEEDLKGRYYEFGYLKKLAYSLALPYIKYQERKVYKNSKHFWALSNYTLRSFKASTKNEHTSTLLPPIDLDLFKPASTEEREPIIIFTGRYNDTRKNIPRLLGAFRKVLDLHPNAILKLIGDEAEPRIVYLIKRLNIGRRVQLIKSQPREKLIDQYQNAQVFVIPSNQEGLCISGIEAMACGLPIVSTRCGGPETYIRHGLNGLLSNGSEESIAKQLVEILSNQSLRIKFGHAARKTVMQLFSIELFDKKIEMILNQIPN